MKKRLGFILLAFTFLLSTTNAIAAISDPLDTYVLFATENLSFKGGNTAGTGNVWGGNVGVNRATGETPMMEVGINGRFIMSPNTQLVGASIRLGVEATVYNVYANQQLGLGWGTPGVVNGTVSTFTAPVFNPMPLLFDTSFTAGTTDITVAKNTVYNGGLPLAPGAYQDLQVMDGATINLTAGTYTFRRLNTGQGFTIHTVPGTIIQITGDSDPNSLDMQFNGNGSFVGSAVPGVESVALFRYLGTDVQFSDGSTFYGVILAPNADIGLGRGMELYGRFIGEQIHSDYNDNVWYRQFTPVPIPAAAWLLGSGLLGLVALRRRMKK